MKRDKLVILSLATIFVLALFVLLIAGKILGWNFLGWFISPKATWLYVIISIYLFVSIGYLIREWLSRL